MTLTLDTADTKALDGFDTITHMAFGDGNSTPDTGQLGLDNELLRTILVNTDKDIVTNEYEFVGRVPITQLNSATIREVGLFDAASGGNMGGRALTPVEVTKTSDDEILIKLRVRVNTINN